jgi:hypothetical protein
MVDIRTNVLAVTGMLVFFIALLYMAVNSL